MTVARKEERGVQGVPSASLLHLNRNSLANILVVGGSPGQRAAIAGALHEETRLRAGPWCAVDARRDADRLYRALLCWLGHDASEPPLACERGTLFVDHVSDLSADVQRLLSTLASRLDGVPAESRLGPGPSRLAAGSAVEPAGEVLGGRLLAELHDSLEKICVRVPASEGPRPAP